jgi:hypothetical protein
MATGPDGQKHRLIELLGEAPNPTIGDWLEHPTKAVNREELAAYVENVVRNVVAPVMDLVAKREVLHALREYHAEMMEARWHRRLARWIRGLSPRKPKPVPKPLPAEAPGMKAEVPAP